MLRDEKLEASCEEVMPTKEMIKREVTTCSHGTELVARGSSLPEVFFAISEVGIKREFSDLLRRSEDCNVVRIECSEKTART